jgi:hypothetical protein
VTTFSTTRHRVPLDGLNLSEQVGLKIEDSYGLKGFRGRTNPTKGPAIIQTATALIRRRAFFHLHSDLPAETVDKLREKPREFWLDCENRRRRDCPDRCTTTAAGASRTRREAISMRAQG